MIIKIPPIYDVSHWKEIPDFSIVAPRPELFITKATEGTAFIDDKFERFFSEAARVGWQRGCYHFNRKGFNPVRQARHFCDFIRPHITPKDFLILDVEEGGEKASDLWATLEYIHEQFPLNWRIIYGRKNLLDPIPMTEAERAYFRTIPIWAAGYPIFPDLYNSMPVGYVPDQTKWGPVWLWQYSAHGRVTGIQGDVDLNLATPEFVPVLFEGEAEPLPEPEPEEPMPITVTGRTLAGSSRVRMTADLDAPIVTLLDPYTAFASEGHKLTADGYEWLNIVTPVVGWLALTSNIELDPAPTPDPSPASTVTVTVESDITATIDGVAYRGRVVVEGVELVRA